MAYQTEYTSVKVPKVLAEKIMNKTKDQGYRSVSEFVLESTRRRLEEFE
ncbi:MAG: ribbon-helix-helix domain-containing protein [Nitrosarchaeum sp.]|nr:ribbon-helix-helix domain-containing protein [Nitrosarchaeum sp.]